MQDVWPFWLNLMRYAARYGKSRKAIGKMNRKTCKSRKKAGIVSKKRPA